jgi:hypothetical protein
MVEEHLVFGALSKQKTVRKPQVVIRVEKSNAEINRALIMRTHLDHDGRTFFTVLSLLDNKYVSRRPTAGERLSAESEVGVAKRGIRWFGG